MFNRFSSRAEIDRMQAKGSRIGLVEWIEIGGKGGDGPGDEVNVGGVDDDRRCGDEGSMGRRPLASKMSAGGGRRR